MSPQKIYITETQTGTVIAATNTSPYFRFEAESEDAVIEIVRKALIFFNENKHKPSVSRAQASPVYPFHTTKVIDSEALVAVG